MKNENNVNSKISQMKSLGDGSSYDGEFEELNDEIDKMVNCHKLNFEGRNIYDSFEENSSLNTTPTPIIQSSQHFKNNLTKIKDINQQDFFHNFIALSGNRNDNYYQYQKKNTNPQFFNNNPYQKMYMQNFINNNNNNYLINATPKLHSNFNFPMSPLGNSQYYINNKYATPTFDFIQMNTQLTPVINNNQFLTPIQPFNNCFQRNFQHPINYNLNNNSKFFSVNINNVTASNQETNDEMILDNMLSKQYKFKKNHKSPQKNSFNNYDFINSNNKNTISSTKKKFFQEDEKEYNIIDIDSIIQGKDRRTTIMIKNIPNKYTITTFLDEINVDFKNKYDIFYLPIDYGNKCNLGFAFINFVDSFHIISFYDLYRGKKWKRFNSEKTCELLYAKIQGKKDLISHFEKGKVLSFESEDKRPLILPTPNPLPNIVIPFKFYDKFRKCYPYVHFICESEGKEDRKFIFNSEYLLYGK